MNTSNVERADGASDRRHLLTPPDREHLASETDELIERLRVCRDQLATARDELAESLAACGWAARRYEIAATRARTTATAWTHTHGRYEATSRALRRQFVDAVASAERFRHERQEVSGAADLLRREIEQIEREMVGIARQIGDLVATETKLGDGLERPAA